MIKSLILFILSASAIMFIAGCKSSINEKRMIVTVSIEPQRWLAERIVGDKADIKVLLLGDANPENFDPPISALRDASRSALFMQMGHLPWESALIEKIKAGREDLLVVDTSDGIELIHGGHSHDDHECEEIDPHTWTSVKNARIIASNMLKGLQTADPAHADFYATNYKALDAELDSLDRSISSRLSSLRGKVFIVWHPSLSYFARDYGLKQLALGMENKEMTLPMMQQKIEQAKQGSIGVFFVQPQMDAGGKADPVIDAAGAVKRVIRPLSPDWKGELENIVDALTDSVALINVTSL